MASSELKTEGPMFAADLRHITLDAGNGRADTYHFSEALLSTHVGHARNIALNVVCNAWADIRMLRRTHLAFPQKCQRSRFNDPTYS